MTWRSCRCYEERVVRHDGVVWSYAEIMDQGPYGLGNKTVVYDTSNGPRLVCIVALSVPKGAPIENGEVAVTAELEQ